MHIMKELDQRRIQYRTGAKVDRVQAWVDWSHKGQKGQQHHSLGSS